MKKNFANTLQFATRFLGLNSDCVEQLKEEGRYITYKVVPLENKKIGFEVTLRGKLYVFTPEQVLGYFLKKLKKFFENADITTKDIVISVPSYYSNVER
jgi:molecular chaperone DnaK (HSP70)